MTQKLENYFGARFYNAEYSCWLSVDPLSDKYPYQSPYVYCGNNPLNVIDPDGMDEWELNNKGEILKHTKTKEHDKFTVMNDDGTAGESISFKYGTVESQRSIPFSLDGKTTDTYDVYKVRGDDNGTKLFEFMSNNISESGTGVEISQAMTGIVGDKGLNFITTGHMKATEPGMTHLLNGQLLHGYTIRELNHSHPYTPNPSNSDNRFASQITNIMKQQNVPTPAFNLYYVPGKQKIPFSK